MRARRALGVLIAVLGGIAATPYVLVREDLHAEEIREALRPLSRAPLAQLAQQHALTLDVAIPSEPPWPRVNAQMGRPEWLVTAVARKKDSNWQYAPNEVPLSVTVDVGGRRVETRNSDRWPYGYSGALNGVIFRALEGEVARIAVSTSASSLPDGQLVVLPVWGGWTVLDHFNVAMALQQFQPTLRTLSYTGMALGVAGSLLALWPTRGARGDV